jgi:Spy/CpxP family protein refolding chaperone
MTRHAIMAAVLMAAANLAVAVQAQFPPGADAPPLPLGLGPDLPRLMETLTLTEEQQSHINAVVARNRENMKPLLQRAREADMAFRAALEAENPDVTAVGQAALAMHAARKKLHAARSAAFEEVKSVLTDEQREELEGASARLRLRPRPGVPLDDRR